MDSDLIGTVAAVHRSEEHTFSKVTCKSIELIAGLGVNGDAHQGATVKHRSRVAANPNQPNLRQVHLVMSELLNEVSNAGHDIVAGQLGENITTTGIDLVSLPVGSMLRIGDTTLVALTGLRNPCHQIKSVGEGVMKMMFIDDQDNPDGPKIGRTGVMGVVIAGGIIAAGDEIKVRFPAGPLTRMEKV
jgi:MOSC domain-containing protein YiiM|tara:strand:+ start:3701 stop:4264 length:564 start_codon:yes stop_codon:yes gene_type:complete